MGDATHDELARMWEEGLFEPQIHHIRFPHLKNLEPGLQIACHHPLTAIVGPNGTNKSTILRALQGCPDYENIGNYWFGTALDEIRPGDRHRFIHGRWSDAANAIVEVIKTRIQRRTPKSEAMDPDYFEPSRPLLGDEMEPMPSAHEPLSDDRTKTRWKAIDKHVEYIDFRAEISAFDKYFHHNDYRSRRSHPSGPDSLRARKQVIRNRSKYVKRMLDPPHPGYDPYSWLLEPTRPLSEEELTAVSTILGRPYTKVEVVAHRAFEVAGTTARMFTGGVAYTEAWAGSGEFAVVQLVTRVRRAPAKALVLLDEPEVSLHPGAQRGLVQFLMNESRAKKLQIVFATHSHTMIETLPREAIKVLDIEPAGTVVIAQQRALPEQAFATIGHVFRKRTVVVEDALAKEIVVAALRGDGSGDTFLGMVDVRYYPGGASRLRTGYLPTWAIEGRDDVLLLLDGDMDPESDHGPPDSIGPNGLKEAARALLDVSDLDRYVAANSGGPTDEQLRAMLEWAHRHVAYLPGDQPEEWLAAAIDGDYDPASSVAKDWWVERTRSDLGLLDMEDVKAHDILATQRRALAVIRGKDKDLESVRARVVQFLERAL